MDLGLSGQTIVAAGELYGGGILDLDGGGALSIEKAVVSEDGSARQLEDSGLPLVGLTISAAEADEVTGTLHLVFDSGLRFSVPPDPDYEAWHLTTADMITGSSPGGGLW